LLAIELPETSKFPTVSQASDSSVAKTGNPALILTSVAVLSLPEAKTTTPVL